MMMSAGERRLWERLERGDVPGRDEASERLTAVRKAKRARSRRVAEKPTRRARVARDVREANAAAARQRKVYRAVDKRSGGVCELDRKSVV